MHNIIYFLFWFGSTLFVTLVAVFSVISLCVQRLYISKYMKSLPSQKLLPVFFYWLHLIKISAFEKIAPHNFLMHAIIYYLFSWSSTLFVTILGIFSVIYLCVQRMHISKCMNNLPAVKQVPLLLTWRRLYKSLAFERVAPANCFILQIGCGICHVFERERIAQMWVGIRPFVHFYKPETVEILLSSHSTIDKSKEYNFLHSWLGTGLLTSTGDKWRLRRKRLTPSFHFRILEDFMPVYNEQSYVLVEKMTQLAQKEWVDVVPLITMCTLDIICETTMGVHINAQGISDSEYVRAVYGVGEMLLLRALRPWFWFDIIFYSFPCGWKFKRNLNILHSFTRKIIREKKELLLRQRKENPLQNDINQEQHNGNLNRPRRAFLELLLEHHIIDNTLSEEDIREEVDTFMFEGHDTTAMTICWALYNIGLRPDVQEKIQMELESVLGGDTERPVTSDDLKAMKYLDCVLKESLRLYPTIPFIARQLREDIQVLNYTVAKGATCVIFPYVLHRDSEVYPNPEVFDPDRFLPEQCAGRHPYAYIPFSAGPRNCIGQKFAIMEEKTVIANILRNFAVKSLDHRDKVNLVPDLILRNVGPMRMKLIPRL